MLRPEFIYLRRARILRCAVPGILALGLIFPSLASATTPEEELKQLHEALAASSSRNENFTAELQNLSSEIRTLKQNLVSAAGNLTALDQKLVNVEERLEEIRQVEDDTLADLSKRNGELAGTLSALVNLSRQPEGTLIGNPAGLVDSLRASALLQSILPKLKKDADQLSRQLEALASLRQQYAKEKEEFAALRDERVTEQQELDQLLAAKRTAQEKIAAASKTEQDRLEKLTSDVKDTTALIARLQQEKERQQALEKERIEREIALKEKQQQEIRNKLAEKEETPPPESEARPAPPRKLALAVPARHFVDAKGTLPLPVGGRIVSNYNEKKAAGQQKGIIIESRADAAVISPFDGQIAFAGPFRHYGLLLIIDHGDGYHTLLAGMGSIDGTVGQLLLAGEPVGQMKNSSKEKPKLYMELRNNGAPIDPVPWLMATNGKVSG